MKKIYLMMLVVAVTAVSGCGLTKKDLGLGNHGPDESKVITNAPLTLPPEYGVRPQKSIVKAETDNTEDEE